MDMETLTALLFLIMTFTGILVLIGIGVNIRLGKIIKQNSRMVEAERYVKSVVN
jgi:hypothetical protein